MRSRHALGHPPGDPHRGQQSAPQEPAADHGRAAAGSHRAAPDRDARRPRHRRPEPARRPPNGAGVADHVRLLGPCPQDELEALYALADCLLLPTRYEGFGLPVLEAMIRGVPVVCSDIPPLREITGEAALRFDPDRAERRRGRARAVTRRRGLATRLRHGRARARRAATAGRPRPRQRSASIATLSLRA